MGGSSKKERAERGLRMAFMPKPINMVPNTLAAMRREGDWERREVVGLGAMFFFSRWCGGIVGNVGNVQISWCFGRLLVAFFFVFFWSGGRVHLLSRFIEIF